MVIEPHLNLTQIAGVIAFFAAALGAACVALGSKSRPGHRARVWWLIAAAHLALGVEVIMGTRHGLHNYLDGVLHDSGVYPWRAEIQVVLLIVCALCIALAHGVVCRWLAGIPGLTGFARRSAVVTVAVLALFMVESVSLHAIDQMLYASVGPVRAIAYLWVCAVLVIVANAWSELHAK